MFLKLEITLDNNSTLFAPIVSNHGDAHTPTLVSPAQFTTTCGYRIIAGTNFWHADYTLNTHYESISATAGNKQIITGNISDSIEVHMGFHLLVGGYLARWFVNNELVHEVDNPISTSTGIQINHPECGKRNVGSPTFLEELHKLDNYSKAQYFPRKLPTGLI